MSTANSVHQSGDRLCHTCGCACELHDLGADHYWVCTNGECRSTWSASRKELGTLVRYAAEWDRSAHKLRRRSVRVR